MAFILFEYVVHAGDIVHVPETVKKQICNCKRKSFLKLLKP